MTLCVLRCWCLGCFIPVSCHIDSTPSPVERERGGWGGQAGRQAGRQTDRQTLLNKPIVHFKGKNMNSHQTRERETDRQTDRENE